MPRKRQHYTLWHLISFVLLSGHGLPQNAPRSQAVQALLSSLQPVSSCCLSLCQYVRSSPSAPANSTNYCSTRLCTRQAAPASSLSADHTAS